MTKTHSGIEWLDSLASEASFTPQERSLDTMRALLAALDHPEQSFRPIHITGTAGKGSVAEMITRILIAAGIRVGTYGSPHVYRVNERIRIDGKEVTDARLDETLKTVHFVSVQIGIEPRWFEALTAAAFVIFRDERLPWAVVEVGLGGRLDTTNIFDHPAITMITSIGLDHQEFLGNTETEIARDKAGIFRAGVPALIGEVSTEAHAAIAAEAHRIGAPLIDIRDRTIELPTVPALPGQHQTRNAQLAIAAVSVIASETTQSHEIATAAQSDLAMTIREDDIIEGLQAAQLPGRFEILSQNPLVIFDVAHNPMKIAALVETIIDQYPDDRFTTIIGIKKDKDAAQILQLVDQITDRYIFLDLPDVPHWNPAELRKLTKKSSSLTLDWDRWSPLLITGSFHLGHIVQTLGL